MGVMEAINSVLWGVPMMALLLLSGAYFTAGTGAFQLRHWLHCLKMTVFSRSRKNSGEGAVTPFQAMASSLAATLGTGNIAGVAAALTAGGAAGKTAASGAAARCTTYATG